ncbi:MAG: zinc-binding dehydrogenase [Geminicoccaceae bacterium]
MAKRLGADAVVASKQVDAVDAIMLEPTNGRGVDAAIEALGLQQTFASCLKVRQSRSALSSLGVYSSDLTITSPPSMPASATTGSSPRSARAARSACAG